ncbi:MAG: PDZ domain-containing protein, partial [Gemmatimonadaceae bacterium]
VAGVAVQGFNPDTPDNPARRAGVQAGDIIVAADGQPTDRQSALQRIVRNHAPGETVKLDVMRYGKKMSFDVKLAEMPTQAAQATATPISMNRGGGVSTGPKLGVTLTALPPDGQRPPGMPSHGVLVTDVVGLSPAYSKLGGGDVITDVLYPAPARAINSPAELQSVLSSLKAGGYISLEVVSPTDNQGGVFQHIVNIRLGS